MRFVIDRVASGFGKQSDPSPCRQAFQTSRTSETTGSTWYQWEIDVDSIEDLAALSDEVGESLVFNSGHITIYDGYME